MTADDFLSEVLGMLGSDFEAPRTIAADLSRELERPVTEREVRTVLLELASKGWALASLFEASTGSYLPIEAAEAAQEPAAWYSATTAGMAAYEYLISRGK
jgi:hypothetical protein